MDSAIAGNMTSDYIYSEHTRVVDLGIMITLLILGVIGNPLVLILYHRLQKKRKSPSPDYFVVNMVVADCFVVLCYGPLIANVFERRNVFEDREGLCQFFGFLSLTVCVCSLYSLTALAVWRWIQVCYPQHAGVLNRYRAVWCGSVWAVCLAISAPPLQGSWGGYAYFPESVFCTLDYRASLSYTLVIYLGAEGASITLTVIAYYRLFRKLRDSGQKMAAHISKEGKARRYQAVCSMMLSALFIASWSPYCVICLVDIFVDLEPWLIKYSTWLGMSNSAVNGFVYILINKHYRLALGNMLRLHNRVHAENHTSAEATNSVRNQMEMKQSNQQSNQQSYQNSNQQQPQPQSTKVIQVQK